MKATRSPTVIAPAATRAPPTPSTSRKAPWTAIEPTGPTSACSRATRSPAVVRLLGAAADGRRPPAPRRRLARMVRAAEMARSTAEVISPIRSWACSGQAADPAGEGDGEAQPERRPRAG